MTMSDKINRPKPRKELPVKDYVKRKFSCNHWRRLCSVKNCETQAQKNGQCHRHFTANIEWQKLTEPIGAIHNNRKYTGCYWRRICSVNKCQKYAQKNGLCKQHFRESNNRPESTENTTISHHSAILKSPTRNHSKHNTSDGYRKYFCSLNFMFLNSSSIVIWSQRISKGQRFTKIQLNSIFRDKLCPQIHHCYVKMATWHLSMKWTLVDRPRLPDQQVNRYKTFYIARKILRFTLLTL